MTTGCIATAAPVGDELRCRAPCEITIFQLSWKTKAVPLNGGGR